MQGAEGMRDRDNGDAVVPAASGSALEVGQAQGVLHLPAVVLDAPAELGEPDQRGQRHAGGQVGQPELHRIREGRIFMDAMVC